MRFHCTKKAAQRAYLMFLLVLLKPSLSIYLKERGRESQLGNMNIYSFPKEGAFFRISSRKL